jgi:diguanylate cyclase (GGDEF)-like protein/PAS domain S-box-containing protein
MIATQEITGELEALIKAIPEGLMIINPSGVILYHNQKAREYLNPDEADITGRRFGYRVAPDEITEIEVYRPDQSPHIFEARSVKLVWNGDDAYLITLIEITESKRSEIVLRKSEEKLSKLFHANPDCVVLTHLKTGLIVDVNEGFVDLFGYRTDEVINRTTEEIHIWCDPVDREEYVQRLLATGECMDYETTLVTKDGWVMPVNISARTIELDQQISTLSIIRDISQYKNSERALQKANEKLSLWIEELEKRNKETRLLNDMGDMLQSCLSIEEAYKVVGRFAELLFTGQTGALYVFNTERHLLQKKAEWGEKLYSLDEFDPEDCWGIRRGHLHEMIGNTNALLCNHINLQDHENGFIQNICVPLIAQGETLGSLYLQFQPGQDMDHWKQLCVSIAERAALDFANQRLRYKLHQQSIRDPLTGLFNRRYMEETLHRELRRAIRHRSPLGMVMIDVDYFKNFNDKYGHEVGDQVLKELGNYLLTNLRTEDIVCRYGGEEFIIILPDASLKDTEVRALQWKEAVKTININRIGTPMENITISLGVAGFPEHGDTPEDLLRAIDGALYDAKNAGRDCVKVAQVYKQPAQI